MTYIYTDKQLNHLNRYKNVYSVDPDYAKRNGYEIVTENPNRNHSSQDMKETNIVTSGNQKFEVIATKNDKNTGFQGLAVAPLLLF
ncbi:hypothetical protein [Streptococcus oricebi]|uniref:Uncharacterized protein n=1 Tax=Streptococcus oricebi TaxID=1547447 RepID=A0ABS5B599_9STRE|nr:hypothetical protein [Streptococcus oricebi]MBP2623984.1 hypothetical protein [Streptococcus oricebi]